MSRIQHPLRAAFLAGAIACVSAGTLLALGSQSFAATFTEFDAPGAGNQSGQGTQVFGMNANGDIVGAYTASDDTRHSFIRVSDGSFVSFTPDSGTSAVAINGDRETTGSVATDSGQTGFVAAPDGTVTTFDVLGATAAQALAINDRGVVTGDFLDSNGHTRAFVRGKKGHVKAFDAPNTPKETIGSAIDHHGDIAGLFEDSSNLFHGFLRDAAGNITVIDVPSATRTTAVAINNDATVVGIYRLTTTGPAHAYIRTTGGALTTFDVPAAGTGFGQGTFAQSINRRGKVSGVYIDGTGVVHGFVRSVSGRIATFSAPGASTSAGTGTSAAYVGSHGSVGGQYTDSSGVFHGYIRMP